MSIAGGYHKAVERAVTVGCDCLQIFTANPRSLPTNSGDLRFGKFLTKNTNQWRGKPITAEEARQFRAATAASGVACPLAHDSYLINLASPDETLWKKSIDTMIDEVQRAAVLGIPWVVSHPGAYTTTSEAEGLKRIIAALDEVLGQSSRHSPSAIRPKPETSENDTASKRRLSPLADGTGTVPATLTGILLETTAGQGTALGWRFEHLAAILAGVKDNSWLGVCFDTCHVFAAGYKISTQSDYRATMKQFDQIVGLDRIRAFHLNDSVKDRGSRVDRHAGIGCGKIGPEAFGWLLRDRRFRNVPMVLETPKGKENGEDLDVINLRKLRALVR
jgi:deoxyribonuclease-4